LITKLPLCHAPQRFASTRLVHVVNPAALHIAIIA
jgi:hypothetical protein